MLLELKVSNFAIIDSLEVQFLRPGLNVLTGETGAGKSIILKSLGLLLGGRGSPDVVRAGCENAIIEGAFDLSYRPDVRKELADLSLESGDDGLVIRRVISSTGKHRLYINGNLSTLNILEKIVPQLIEITGQNEHHSLVKPQAQLHLLDEFAELLQAREKFKATYDNIKGLQEEIENLTAAQKEREQRLDFLRFQVGEIEAFGPKPEEDNQLGGLFEKAKSLTKILNFAQKAETALDGDELNIAGTLQGLSQEGEHFITLEPKFKNPVAALREASVILSDVAHEFRHYLKTESVEGDSLEKIESRHSDLKKLLKKYGPTLEDLMAFKETALQEIEKLERSDETLKDLQLGQNKALKEQQRQGEELTQKREKAAKKLTAGINQEIKDLNMKGTEFSVKIEKLATCHSTGFDEVTFMIRSSPQDAPKPISKVASGGELSRLMLAIKQIVSAKDRHQTYLFDEVDAGVSGPTAEKVGRKLKKIGSFHQVICITHLPQVAAFADAHFLITKEVSKNQVKSHVRELGAKERVSELGRLISGERVTASSLTHAQEMIKEFSGRI